MPPIKTEVAAPNMSAVNSAVANASKQVVKIKTEVDNSFMGGLSNSLSGQKGNFANVGKELGSSLTMGMQSQFGMAGGAVTSLAGALGGVGIAAVAGGAALVALGAASVGLAKDWQTMMAGVSKTTGLEGAELDALGAKLQEIRMQTGATAESITGAVVTAGSIGIPKGELAEFAKLSLQMGSAFGMSADTAASGIAAIGNSTKPAGESWTEFGNKAGSSINVLADTYRTSEEQIITGMKHLAGTFGLLKPPEDTIPAWQALVATIQSLGLEGDSAGEALKDASTYITRNEKGKISDLLGITGEQLQLDVRSNAPELFQRIALAIKALPLEQQGEALKAFGQSGAQGIGMLMGDIDATTGKFKILGGAIETSESAWTKATSMSDAYGKSQATLDASLGKLTASLAVAGTKLGTVMLPALTTVVDILTLGTQAATSFGESIYSMASGTAAAVGAAVGGGSLADVDAAFLDAFGITIPGKSNEVSSVEMGKQTASIYTDYVNQGIQAGNFDPVSGKMKDVGKEAGDTFGEGFLQKLKDAKVSEQMGALIYDAAGNIQMSDTAALAAINSQSTVSRNTRGYDEALYSFMDKYTLQTRYELGGQTGTLTLVDASGKAIDSQSYLQGGSALPGNFDEIADGMRKAIKPAILDMPKYLKSVKNEMSGALEDILSDGVVEFTEKNQLGEYIKHLNALQIANPMTFELSNAEELRDELTAAASGIKVTLDTSETEANFEIWLQEKADYFVAQKQSTGVMPLREEQRRRQEWELTADPKLVEWVNQMETAATSNDPGKLSGVKVFRDALLDAEPALVKETWFRQLAATDMAEFNEHVKQTGNTFTGIDESGKPIPILFFDTTTALASANGGLTDFSGALDALNNKIYGLSLSFNIAGVSKDVIGQTGKLYNPNIGGGIPYSMSGTKYKSIPAVVSSQYASIFDLSAIPKLGNVSKVSKQTGGGLALLGEKGEDEFVVPVSALKGLWPQSAKVDMASINYKPFLDYPAPSISAGPSYPWAKYPQAPQVQEFNTDAIQTAWLADNQLSTRDIYSGLVRDAQLAQIGKSQVIPWFARGDIKQPSWWTEAATKLSPQYKENWEANKGGTVPKIGADVSVSDTSEIAAIAQTQGITIADATAFLYGENFTEGCIRTNPIAPGTFTPSQQLIDEMGKKDGAEVKSAVAFLYADSCIEGLKIGNGVFTPSQKLLDEMKWAQGDAWGSQLVGSSGASSSGEIESTLGNIEKNTAKSADKIGLAATYTGQMVAALKSPIQGFDNGSPFSKLSMSSMPGGALVTGLSKEGYLATYDPRTDTCEGMSFVAPDASLKTTDKFYLGLAENSPYRSEDKSPGYGWSNVAQPMNESDAQLMKINEQSYKEQQQAAKDTAKIEKNTRELSTDMKASMSGKGYDESGALVSRGGGGGSGWFDNAGGAYGSILVQNTVSSNPSSDWGSSGGAAVWMSAATPGFAWANGGISYGEPSITPGGNIFAEKPGLVEAFVPISDRAAGLKILPQVMRELGVRQFASGGFAGSNGMISAAIGPSTINLGGITINNPPKNMSTKQLAKEVVEQVEAKFYKARKR